MDEKKSKDLYIPVDSSGTTLKISDTGVDIGTLKPAVDGAPIPSGADYVHLTRCGEHLHGETLYSNSNSSEKPVERSGPAKVATPAYRSGWDNIFGKSNTVGQA